MRLLLICVVLCMVIINVNGQAPVFEQNQKVDRAVMNCEICQAVVRELSRSLATTKTGAKKGREMEIFHAMDKLCDMEHFRAYEYSPPTMIKACNDFIGQHGEELETAFFKSNDDAALRETICMKKLKRCKKLWSNEEIAKLDADADASAGEPSTIKLKASDLEKPPQKPKTKSKKSGKGKAATEEL